MALDHSPEHDLGHFYSSSSNRLVHWSRIILAILEEGHHEV